MTDKSRRDFLKSSAALGGAAAAATVFPDAIRKALAIEANNATKSIMDVEHVVILMQENRAFDHYFGTMAGVRGYGDRFPIPLPGGRDVFSQSNGERIILPYHLDQNKGNAQRVTGTPHSWSNCHAAWDHGRITEWPLHKENQSMGYYTETEIPFQRALADAFTLCDNYHCATQTGTHPNRIYHWTGTNGPTGSGEAVVMNENRFALIGPSFRGYDWMTYPERLQDAGVSWKLYQNMPDNSGCNPLVGFRNYRAASAGVGNSPIDGLPWWPYVEAMDAHQPLYKGAGNTMPVRGLLGTLDLDVRRGKLPQVSWIVPPSIYCEHPSVSSPVQGAWYVQRILEILTSDEETWSKTVFIVNYDENDGFFDHVPPPAVFSRNADGSAAGGTTMDEGLLGSEYFTHPAPEHTDNQPEPDGRPYGPGPRVPCFVISPWSRGGWVASETFDHSSVLRFLETRFGVIESNISPYRRAICGDLTSCFDFVSPNTSVPSLPTRSKASADALRLSQDFRSQIEIPDEASQRMPKPAVALRRSRALPYELYVDATEKTDGIALRFRNTGTAGAVFHVYDRLHLDRIPRRYMVEAGKRLGATWDLGTDGGAYDLWVLGPNAYHRHFTGSVAATGGAGPEIAVVYDKAHQCLNLRLSNDGARSCQFKVEANAYEALSRTVRVGAGASEVLRLSLGDQGNWYDYTVTVAELDGFSRRFAGRMEVGRDGIADPAAVLDEIFAG
ncbi:phospholipase C, phosphocholine-specific [Zavarzinia compransoris]|uniref:phosphocholine-specific phospholipase C n=1 Tax=Zavarzinia marina TaxID=2911065 RepID=UPI001F2C78CF|nr:phospholipase C, phosphocholine-specific [Zavarzinia marina]MCF4164775.1 phospholipase C, phosphocholine-specific [Zavarzinia marina]